MIEPLLVERLQPAVRRTQIRRVFFGFSLILTIATAVAVGLIVWNRSTGADISAYWFPLAITTCLFLMIAMVWGVVTGGSLQKAIQKLEAHFPELDSSLVTAAEQEPENGARALNFLQQEVVKKALYHSYDNSWGAIVPGGHLFLLPMCAMFAFFAFGATLINLIWYSPAFVDPNVVAFDDVQLQTADDFELSIEPGDAEVEKGTSLLVLARFGTSLPSEVAISYTDQDGTEKRVEMRKSLDDPVFGARIPDIDSALKYRVKYASQESNEFNVSVFEYPALVRSDAEIEYPEYTELENKVVQDVRRVSAVQGSSGKLIFNLNKSVSSAVLQTEDGETIELTANTNNQYQTIFPFNETGRKNYRLKLIDLENRENKNPPLIVLNTLENKAPEIKLTSPSPEIQVSALEEILVKAKTFDDFGVRQLGIAYTLGDGEEQNIVLVEATNNKKSEVDHLLALEDLQAVADQFLTYYVWAEDFGPDGETRRVSSDIFFAEVRAFDEIYRQGEAPAGGPQQQGQQQGGQGQNAQNAQQAQQLADLQKQIITAEWNMIRRESGKSVSSSFSDDIQVLIESQATALQQVEALTESLQDDRSKQFADEARTFMNQNSAELQNALDHNSADPLKEAIKKAKGAQQSLLKLRQREHQVVRQQQQQQQQQQSQNQANQQRQQQLNQLELDNEENRYQQEQQALQNEDPAEQEEQRENRQILSRLRELAQRQNDLNEKVKELQTALDEAETEEEKEEIERELKRLREEQQQIMRDAEQLQERMENSESQESMTEPSEQLEQARDSARRASEALEQNDVTRAAAEGERTEQELEELRDEFQNRTSGQFAEQMREMRNEAQDIAQKEDEIQDRMNELDRENPNDSDRSLRTSDSREQLANDLEQQQERVRQLREQMRETIEEAEEFEPLLADELYESYRESEQMRLENELDSAERSTRRGFMDDAREQEQRANDGIEELRDGIEQAAESILGDETQALEAARDTVRQLRNELEDELNRNNPDRQANEPGDSDDPESAEEGSQQAQQNGQPNQEPQNEQNQTGNASSDSEPREQTEGEQQQGQGGKQPGQSNLQQENQPESDPNQTENQQNEQNSGQQPGPNQGQRRDLENQRPGLRGGRDQFGQELPRQPNEGTSADPNLNDRDAAPLTGEDFLDWSDRLRDVEEMVNDPELRAEASRIRDRAKEIRKDYKRHSKDPNWDLVDMEVAQPLIELQTRLTQELMRRSNRNAVVPLDREEVPTQFKNTTDEYFKRLGIGR